jgi:hypothetical protein
MTRIIASRDSRHSLRITTILISLALDIKPCARCAQKGSNPVQFNGGAALHEPGFLAFPHLLALNTPKWHSKHHFDIY